MAPSRGYVQDKTYIPEAEKESVSNVRRNRLDTDSFRIREYDYLPT